jgi:hypothetical protein
VIAGIDTHKDTLAVSVVDEAGRLVAGGDVPNTERGFVQLVGLFNTHHVQRVRIEGSGSFGRAVAVHLVVCWQPDREVAVVEVPTLMTSRERHGQLGKGKTAATAVQPLACAVSAWTSFDGRLGLLAAVAAWASSRSSSATSCDSAAPPNSVSSGAMANEACLCATRPRRFSGSWSGVFTSAVAKAATDPASACCWVPSACCRD